MMGTFGAGLLFLALSAWIIYMGWLLAKGLNGIWEFMVELGLYRCSVVAGVLSTIFGIIWGVGWIIRRFGILT